MDKKTKELRMIKEEIANELHTSGFDTPVTGADIKQAVKSMIEEGDMERMQYYLDRATVYKKVLGLLEGDGL